LAELLRRALWLTQLRNDLADAALDIRDRRFTGVSFPRTPLPSLVASLWGSALCAVESSDITTPSFTIVSAEFTSPMPRH